MFQTTNQNIKYPQLFPFFSLNKYSSSCGVKKIPGHGHNKGKAKATPDQWRENPSFDPCHPIFCVCKLFVNEEISVSESQMFDPSHWANPFLDVHPPI